ncbi:MAG: hypothetical protein ABI042_04560 [Verrucomicrobiota bacterium]
MNQTKLLNGSMGIFRIFVFSFLLVGCGKKASEEIDFGTVNNSVYQNKYFAFTMPLPGGWSVQDQEAQQRLNNMGGKLLAGDDKNLKAVIKAAELKTVNLFAVFKSRLGSPVPFNPSIMAMAEKVRDFPGIKSGKDYLFQVKQGLEAGQIKVSISEDILSQKLGGVDFDVMEAEMTIGGRTVQQNYYSTVMKGYALVLVSSFADDEDKSFQKNVLEKITFSK